MLALDADRKASKLNAQRVRVLNMRSQDIPAWIGDEHKSVCSPHMSVQGTTDSKERLTGGNTRGVLAVHPEGNMIWFESPRDKISSLLEKVLDSGACIKAVEKLQEHVLIHKNAICRLLL